MYESTMACEDTRISASIFAREQSVNLPCDRHEYEPGP